MKLTLRLLLALVICLSASNLRPSAPAQGSLTPPGAPAPTMKSLAQLGTNILQVSNLVAQVNNALQQIDTRYAISDFHTNLTLPGSYYLAANLLAGTNATDGINIRTNA